jgi:hypothetical protein
LKKTAIEGDANVKGLRGFPLPGLDGNQIVHMRLIIHCRALAWPTSLCDRATATATAESAWVKTVSETQRRPGKRDSQIVMPRPIPIRCGSSVIVHGLFRDSERLVGILFFSVHA